MAPRSSILRRKRSTAESPEPGDDPNEFDDWGRSDDGGWPTAGDDLADDGDWAEAGHGTTGETARQGGGLRWDDDATPAESGTTRRRLFPDAGDADGGEMRGKGRGWSGIAWETFAVPADPPSHQTPDWIEANLLGTPPETAASAAPDEADEASSWEPPAPGQAQVFTDQPAPSEPQEPSQAEAWENEPVDWEPQAPDQVAEWSDEPAVSEVRAPSQAEAWEDEPVASEPQGSSHAGESGSPKSAKGGHRKFVFLAAATRYAMDLPHDDTADEAPGESVDDEAGAWTESDPAGAEDDATESPPYVGDEAPADRSPGATRHGGHSRHRRRPRRAHAVGAVHIIIEDEAESAVIPKPVAPFSAQLSRSPRTGAARVEPFAAPPTVPDEESPAMRRLALVSLLLLLGIVAAVAQAARHSGTSGEPASASSGDSEDATSTTVSTFVLVPQFPERLTITTIVAPTTATFPPVTTTQPTTTPTTRFVTSTTRLPETTTTTFFFPTTFPQPVSTTTRPPSTTTSQAPTTTTTTAPTTTTTSSTTTTSTSAP